MRFLVAAGAAVAAVLIALFANARRLLNASRAVARTTIRSPEEHTTVDGDGAVRSIQAADVVLPDEQLDALWNPTNLERLARTYWRFLTHITLGAIRVFYDDDGRYVCALARPFVLLSFRTPEYAMDDRRGIVRWRIERGVLFSRRGHRGSGYLEIDVRRGPSEEPGKATLHVEVEVANFYPAIASRLGLWIYANTQSRIHVIVTHAFLRSLARLDLAESRVGRFASIDEVPDPPPAPPPVPAGRRA